jgi:hypothetical protein
MFHHHRRDAFTPVAFDVTHEPPRPTVNVDLIDATIEEINTAKVFDFRDWTECVYACARRALHDRGAMPLDPISHGAAMFNISKIDAMKLFSVPEGKNPYNRGVAIARLEHLRDHGSFRH